MHTNQQCMDLIAAFHKKCSWPEGDKRRGGPLTPNDTATIASLASQVLSLRSGTEPQIHQATVVRCGKCGHYLYAWFESKEEAEDWLKSGLVFDYNYHDNRDIDTPWKWDDEMGWVCGYCSEGLDGSNGFELPYKKYKARGGDEQ